MQQVWEPTHMWKLKSEAVCPMNYTQKQIVSVMTRIEVDEKQRRMDEWRRMSGGMKRSCLHLKPRQWVPPPGGCGGTWSYSSLLSSPGDTHTSARCCTPTVWRQTLNIFVPKLSQSPPSTDMCGLTPCPEQMVLSVVPGQVLKLNWWMGRHLWLKQTWSVPQAVPSST